MTRPLGLHQTSAMDLMPVELIDAAAGAGYNHVSLFTNNPAVPLEGHEDKFVFPKVTEATKQDVLARLDANGLQVVNAEFFLMRRDVDLATYLPGLALARDLGARQAVTHIFEPESSRAVEILGSFCELAQAQEIKVALEFCPMTPGCKSIEQATWFVEQVALSNLGFGICPMHLVRSGGTSVKVAAAAHHVLFGQDNDGLGLHASAAYFDEVHDRELPGDGDFPLPELLRALPAHIPIEVKIPRDSRIRAGEAAQGHIQAAFKRTRALLDDMEPAV